MEVPRNLRLEWMSYDHLLRPTAQGIGSYTISGVSRDAQGNLLGGCTVLLFITGSDALYGKVVSEAVTGAFSFSVPNTTTPYYAVFFNSAGSLAGVTVNTLVGS